MNGILLVDKPAGFTSHDVVAKLRGILRERRIGHAGTLDPMATGLLTVFLGRATRAVQFAENQNKVYEGAMRLGMTTDTQDITGTVLTQTEHNISEDELKKVFSQFVGEQEQLPPMYSAIKKDGKKLYELARKGVEVEREPRKVTIYSLEYRGRQGEDFLFRAACSKGTYIRTLCHDIGQTLGPGAVLTALRRVEAGQFSLDDAHTLEEISEAAAQGRAEELLLSADRLFQEHPAVTIGAAEEAKCRCGNSFAASVADGSYRVYSCSGEFLMLGRAENGVMSTVKSFFEV